MKTVNVRSNTKIKRTQTKRKKQRRRRNLSYLFIFMLFLLCVGAVLSVTVLFPIKNINVTTTSEYSKEEIVKASKIKIGSNLFIISKEKSKNSISKNLPKSGEITIERELPDTVKINVKKAMPKYFFLIDGSFFVADKNFKIIESLDAPPTACAQIKIKKLKGLSLGEHMTTDEATIELLTRLLRICEDKHLNISGIDVSDKLDIKLVLENRLLVKLGIDLDTDYKLAHLAAMLPKMDENSEGTIDLKNWSENNTKSSFRSEKIDSFEFSPKNF